jgi:hypothetical protein
VTVTVTERWLAVGRILERQRADKRFRWDPPGVFTGTEFPPRMLAELVRGAGAGPWQRAAWWKADVEQGRAQWDDGDEYTPADHALTPSPVPDYFTNDKPVDSDTNGWSVVAYFVPPGETVGRWTVVAVRMNELSAAQVMLRVWEDLHVFVCVYPVRVCPDCGDKGCV